MKKFATLLACLTLVLGLSVVNAHAVGVGPPPDPYTSSVEAWADTNAGSDYDSGTSHAEAYSGNPSAYAESEASASGWDIGGWSAVWLSEDAGNSLSAHTHSTVTQEFLVTAAGPAFIDFAWDGYLSISGHYPAWGVYNVQYYLAAYDDLGYNGFDDSDGIYNSLGYLGVDDSSSFAYNFDAGDIGTTFSVTYELETYANVDYLGFSGTGYYIYLDSSFMEGGLPCSLAITGIEGGLEALGGSQVPLPGAFLLLGSGLLGLIGFARKRRIK